MARCIDLDFVYTGCLSFMENKLNEQLNDEDNILDLRFHIIYNNLAIILCLS